MKSTFMAGTVPGTKAEISKANKMANIIVGFVIVSFLVAMVAVIIIST